MRLPWEAKSGQLHVKTLEIPTFSRVGASQATIRNSRPRQNVLLTALSRMLAGIAVSILTHASISFQTLARDNFIRRTDVRLPWKPSTFHGKPFCRIVSPGFVVTMRSWPRFTYPYGLDPLPAN